MCRDCGAADLGQHDIDGDAGRIPGRRPVVSARWLTCAGSRICVLPTVGNWSLGRLS